MAMTKKERAEFDAMRVKLATLAALRWTEPVKRDLPSPLSSSIGDGYTSGYDFNAYSLEIMPAWSQSVRHGLRAAAPSRHGSASQNGRALFSTPLLALQAMRHAVELESAQKLAKIDMLIEVERARTPSSTTKGDGNA